MEAMAAGFCYSFSHHFPDFTTLARLLLFLHQPRVSLLSVPQITMSSIRIVSLPIEVMDKNRGKISDKEPKKMQRKVLAPHPPTPKPTPQPSKTQQGV